MTNYRLFPSTSGPSAATAYSGNFISGVGFALSAAGCWFEGYWWWCAASGQSTAPVECALWSTTLNPPLYGAVVPGTVVSSGTLTAGAWNYIPLGTPVQLAPGLDPAHPTYGSSYVAAVGVNGAFPETPSQFGSGDVYSNGITSGPLTAYRSQSGSRPAPYTLSQGLFSTAGNDPTVTMPLASSSDGNFWVDVQISDTPPGGYGGTYRIWPNKTDANAASVPDSAVAYSVGNEIDLTSAVTVAYIHYFVPPGASASAGLATSARVWNIATGQAAATLASPAWTTESGGAVTIGTYGQWVKAPLTATLSPGRYRVTVYNVNGHLGGWNAKDAATGYFTTGVGSADLVSGPLTLPTLANAQLGTYYPGTGSGATPAQPVFAYSGTDIFPVYTTGNNPPQIYWVDLEAYQAFSLSDSDTGHGTDAGEALQVALSSSDSVAVADIVTSAFDADAVLGTDAQAITAFLSGADTGRGTDAGEDAAGSSSPRDADYAHGEDSGFFGMQVQEEEVLGTEDAVITVLAADACLGTDRELRAWPRDSDAALGTDYGYWSGTITDSDACLGTDACAPPPVQTDTCTAAEFAVIGVYTFQPPFRFTGGQYSLRLPVPAVHDHELLRDLLLWQGERPDGTAFRLAAAHREGRLRFVADSDSCAARSYEDLSSLPVAVAVAPALTVRLEVSP